jgi:hypothetical protein
VTCAVCGLVFRFRPPSRHLWWGLCRRERAQAPTLKEVTTNRWPEPLPLPVMSTPVVTGRVSPVGTLSSCEAGAWPPVSSVANAAPLEAMNVSI